MLEELHVSDLALIDDVWLELGPGLTVLTGETGAGKTVLVGALKLLLGERADAGAVRAGADEAVVEGRFTIGGSERTARRRISAEGRSRCYLDGEMSTVAGLADALGPLVDLHGQHDHQALLAPAGHVAYLDRFAGQDVATALAAYRSAWALHAEAAADRDRLVVAMRDKDRRADALSATVSEIDAVAPKPGEDDALQARLPMMRHGEKLAEAASAAFGILRGEAGAADALAQASGALRAAAGLDPALDALAARLDEAAAVIDDVGASMRDYGEGVEYDADALNLAEARVAALTSLKRKYGPTLADVLTTRERSAAQLEELESGGEGLRRADEAAAAADESLRRAEEALRAARAATVEPFVGALQAAAADLAMPRAAFGVSMTELPREAWTADGGQRVEFVFASESSEPMRPLARIASGGEVSRVMLALKSVLGAADEVPVLVFDEVDAGIGGATALAVGRRLAALAGRHQVLVVTHLAQVAAFAGRQLVVEKDGASGRAVTRVRPVTGPERVAEIARMLLGGDSEAGLAHARELLESAAGTV